jgi:UDP-N-acetylmuramoyl-tripeptide--D-alanyl-D-alanine ligase
MAMNAAAAIACVGAVEGDVHAGAAAMGDVVLTAMRMDVCRTESGVVVVNDSYNANPTSMRAAIDALVELPARRRVAVLGTMAEITHPEAEHLAIARYAAERGVRVVAFGTELYGLAPVTTVEAAVEAVGSLAGGDAVLVKGSRVVGLERVAAAMLLD